tara:strand:+ start:906 stop:1640 length:735 start_codon:yes stop_codon:yes gene_type:complete
MTGTEMVDMLGLRLEDPDQASFTQATKIKAINIAQRTVVSLIDNAYLTELQSIDLATSTAGGGVTANGVASGKSNFTGSSASDLNIDPIRGGVVAVKAYKSTGTTGGSDFALVSLGFANMIEPQDVKRLENSYLAGSGSNPVAYVFQDAIYVEPLTGTDAVKALDVWYVKNPTEYTSGTLSTECEMNVSLHEVILDFAESQLWKMDNKPDRAGVAYTNAINLIKALNDRYQVEKPKGIGTQGRA